MRQWANDPCSTGGKTYDIDATLGRLSVIVPSGGQGTNSLSSAEEPKLHKEQEEESNTEVIRLEAVLCKTIGSTCGCRGYSMRVSEMTLNLKPCNQAPAKAGVEHALDADREDNKGRPKAKEEPQDLGSG